MIFLRIKARFTWFRTCTIYTNDLNQKRTFKCVYITEVNDELLNEVVSVPIAVSADNSEIYLLNPPLPVRKGTSKEQPLQDFEFIRQMNVLLSINRKI